MPSSPVYSNSGGHLPLVLYTNAREPPQRDERVACGSGADPWAKRTGSDHTSQTNRALGVKRGRVRLDCLV